MLAYVGKAPYPPLHAEPLTSPLNTLIHSKHKPHPTIQCGAWVFENRVSDIFMNISCLSGNLQHFLGAPFCQPWVMGSGIENRL